jgi:N4-gp56 family major capsid protein
MAINYAEKYSPIVDERFSIGPLTSGFVNNEYEWVGVETVKVYSIPTAAMNNYSLTGSSRYGTPAELQNDVQELQVQRDRSFTFTIDRKSHDDTMMVMEAGRALRRQIDEVVLPEIDTYRIAALASGAKAAHVHDAAAVTAANAYALFLAAQEDLDNAKVPQGGRFAVVTPGFLNFLKQNENFIKESDMSQRIMITGVVGEVDGVMIVKAPASYFPTGVHCIITNRLVMPSPIKLQDYKIHIDPPGINGWLVEGRLRYDAFILDEKADAIAVIKNPA